MNMEWLKKFWDNHGERLVFVALTLILGAIIAKVFPDLKDKVSGVCLMVLGLLFNKARSPKEPVKADE